MGIRHRRFPHLFTALLLPLLLSAQISVGEQQAPSVPESAEQVFEAIHRAREQNDTSTLQQKSALLLERFPQSPLTRDFLLEFGKDPRTPQPEAIAWLERLMALFPQTPQAIEGADALARLHLALGNHTQAVQVLQTLIQLWKTPTEGKDWPLLLSRAYTGIHDYVEAMDWLEKAEKQGDSAFTLSADRLYLSGLLRHHNIRFDAARQDLERFINLHPEDARVPEAALLLADTLKRQDRPLLAAQALISGLQHLDRQQDKAPPIRVSLLLALATQDMNLSQEDLAILEKRYPGSGQTEALLKWVRARSQKVEEIQQANILLGEYHLRTGKTEESLVALTRAMEQSRPLFLEKLLQKTMTRHLETLGEQGPPGAAQTLWNRYRNRKSFFTAPIFLLWARTVLQEGFPRTAMEILQHINRYRMFRPYWPESQFLIAGILYQTLQAGALLDWVEKHPLPAREHPWEWNWYRIWATGRVHPDRLGKLWAGITLPTTAPDPLPPFFFELVSSRANWLIHQGHPRRALDLLRPLLISLPPQRRPLDLAYLCLDLSLTLDPAPLWRNAFPALPPPPADRGDLGAWYHYLGWKTAVKTGNEQERKEHLNALRNLDPQSPYLDRMKLDDTSG